MSYFAQRMQMIEDFTRCRLDVMQPKNVSEKYNGTPVHWITIVRFLTNIEKHALREYVQMQPAYIEEKLEVQPLWLN